MSGIYTTSRSLGREVPSLIASKYPGTEWQVREVVVKIPGDQVTTSYRSGGRPEDLVLDETLMVPNPEGDTGHTFDTIKREVKAKVDLHPYSFNGDWGATHRGYAPAVLVLPFTQQSPESNFLPAPKMTQSEINRMGAELINSARPTQPEASLAQFLGELKRDGIPQLPLLELFKSGHGPRPSQVGGEYLNIEFGWKPFISDIRKLLTAVANSSKILSQYSRDSGRLVRRRRSLPTEVVTNSWENRDPSSYRFLGSISSEIHDSYPSQPLEVLDRIETSVWFSGAFSYYLDVGDDALSKLRKYEQQANKLLGTRLNADVLYSLAPWSWLVDWFADVGTIVSNASALTEDGLVLRYGYLMRRTVATRYLTYRPLGNGFHGGERVTYTTRYRTERKERARATPYGFGFSSDDLSGRQLAILGALGMTKGSRVGF